MWTFHPRNFLLVFSACWRSPPFRPMRVHGQGLSVKWHLSGFGLTDGWPAAAATQLDGLNRAGAAEAILNFPLALSVSFSLFASLASCYSCGLLVVSPLPACPRVSRSVSETLRVPIVSVLRTFGELPQHPACHSPPCRDVNLSSWPSCDAMIRHHSSTRGHYPFVVEYAFSVSHSTFFCGICFREVASRCLRSSIRRSTSTTLMSTGVCFLISILLWGFEMISALVCLVKRGRCLRNCQTKYVWSSCSLCWRDSGRFFLLHLRCWWYRRKVEHRGSWLNCLLF